MANLIGYTAEGVGPQDPTVSDPSRARRHRRTRSPRRGVGERHRRHRSGRHRGRKIAVTVGALLIAFVTLIATANGIDGWFGQDDLTVEKLLGWLISSLEWLLGVPWNEATEVGSEIGQLGMRALLAVGLANAAIAGMVIAT